MTSQCRPGEVVVGVDASQASVRAARFAAEEAARRSAPLRIVHAVTWFDGMTSPPPGLDVMGLVSSGARSLVEGMADSVAGLLPADRVHTAVVEGDPVDVLRHVSSGAALVVLGERGAGGVEGLLLGSTASGVVAQAACPVVVLPDDTAVRARGRSSVVVGVEGRGDDEVLGFAFAEAAVRRTDLVAVHAWQDVVLGTTFHTISPLADWARVMADEERVLSEALAGWREKEPDVPIREVVVREKAGRALISAGLTAALLVVGHHPHRRFGSTTHAVLHRADCPLAIVPLSGGPSDG
jgi:nucleotide-binding universal stress UspA family protein